VSSFAYNKSTGQCEQFVYGGCLGNANRFGTKAECDAVCNAITTTSVVTNGTTTTTITVRVCLICAFVEICVVQPYDKCQLPIESGECMAYMRRYAYNSSSGECELFIYGGCPGNANRFDYKNECEAECKKKGKNLHTFFLV